MEELTQEIIQAGVNAAAADREIPEPTPVETAPMDPTEEAAMKFTKLLPYVSKLASSLNSKGGVVRVMVAMAEFPLGARKPRLMNEGERQLFAVMQELNGYKSTVLSAFIKQAAEADQLKQMAVSTTAETETNGTNEI